MHFSFSIAGRAYRVDASAALDISIPLDFHGEQPNAFHLPVAASQSAEGGGFVGDTRRGGSCNCETVTFNPHGNGTHTECIGHITDERVAVGGMLRQSMIPAALVTVELERVSGEEGMAGDRVVSRAALERSIAGLGDLPREFFRALVIRTLPNDGAKRSGAYSGANPPYISLAAMRLVRELETEHLLVDLPSVDREDDGGQLTAHRMFWESPRRGEPMMTPFNERTITEMIYAEESIPDGPYLLDLQIPHFILDAAPSRPLLYRVEESVVSGQWSVVSSQ